MSRDIESEFLSAVAKRTRASTDRYLVVKWYGESGVRKRKRIPDLEVVSEEDEVERDDDRNRKVGVQPIPDLEVASDDDEEDEAERDEDRKVRGKRKESGVKVVRRKGKEKKDFVDRAGFGVGVGSEEESESVRDNDESNSRCKGRKDVGGDSVGSWTELGSTSKPVVDVDETASVGVSGNCVENENGEEGSGNYVLVSSEAELGTEVSSSDSEEDDDSDEDYNERMSDLSCCSESASESYADFVEEVAPRDRRQEESYGVECNDNADCNYKISDNVIILDDVFSANENDGSYAKPVAEETLMGGTKEKENADVYSPNNEDRLYEEKSFTGKGFSSKSAPIANKLKENGTKVVDFEWIDFKKNSNHPENKFSKSTCHAQGSAKNEPEVEVTSAWDGGTVQNVNRNKIPTLKSTSSVEPAMLAESGLISGINGKPNVSKINSEAGFSRGVEDNNNNEKPFVVGSVPHIISSNRSMVKPGKTFANKASETMTGHGEDRMPKDYNSNDFVSTGDDAKKAQQQGVYHGRCRQANSKKRTRSWEKIDLFDILFNTLTSKSGGFHEDVVNATDVRQQEDHAELAAPKSYPMLKFTYGVQTPVQVEKTEFEQELDKLWDEFQFELRASEIGSHAHESVKTDKDTSFKSDKIYPTLCNRGKHKFTLDDEVGIKCRICSFVQLEIKYVTPEWNFFSSRRFNRTSSSDDVLEMVDRMQFHDHESKVGETRSRPGGTVWDLIPDVRVKLFPHQQDGFEFIWQNLMGTISLDELLSSTKHGMGGCIISHAPGTGKTRLTIEFLHSYLKLFPCSRPLIIAPAGMLLTWEAEFKKWGVGTPFHNLNSDGLSGKEDETALKMLNASKQSSTIKLQRLIKIFSWKKGNAILGLSYSLFEKLAGQRFDKKKDSQSRNKMDEQGKEFGKIILENAGLVVLDEGHTPRNPRSRIYKALINIQTKKRVILSGTPFQNNLAELFTILSFVRPDFEQTISRELRKFCQRKVRMVNGSSGRSGTEKNVDRDDCEAISELKTKFDPFVHVHKGSVLQESLPGLKDCVMVLNPPQYQKQLVEKIESTSYTYTNFEFEHKLSLATIHPSLWRNEEESFINKRELEARRLEPNEGVKTKFLFEMIRLSEANNEKVLVFSQYLDPLGLIKDQICSLLHWRDGEEVLQLVGKIEPEQRQSIINRFNKPNSSAKVLLASTKACSEGINLVGASRVVLLDVVWNPSVERQAISRAFRLGQKKIVYSYNLIVGRMEWEKYQAQTNKEHVSNLIFCSSDDTKKRGRVLSEDIILEKLINHSSTEGMFDRIVHHPK